MNYSDKFKLMPSSRVAINIQILAGTILILSLWI